MEERLREIMDASKDIIRCMEDVREWMLIQEIQEERVVSGRQINGFINVLES